MIHFHYKLIFHNFFFTLYISLEKDFYVLYYFPVIKLIVVLEGKKEKRIQYKINSMIFNICRKQHT